MTEHDKPSSDALKDFIKRPTVDEVKARRAELDALEKELLAEAAGGQKITRGRIVFVRCYGQSLSKELEHPAMVTKVHPAGVINATIIPDLHVPFWAEKVVYSETPLQDKPAGYSWRWPPKA